MPTTRDTTQDKRVPLAGRKSVIRAQLALACLGEAAMLGGFALRAREAFMVQGSPVSASSMGLFLGGAALVVLVLIAHTYLVWSAIRERTRRTTPLRAAGFLLVPCFNLYWIFVAVYGFVRQYNAHAADPGRGVPRMPYSAHLLFCMAACASVLPYAGVPASAAMLPLLLLVLSMDGRALSRLAAVY